MSDVFENQVFIAGLQEEAGNKLKRPPLPNLTMGKDKKTDKVVITVTDLEKQWIRYLAAETGFKSVMDYLLSFIYEELEEILAQEILRTRRRKRKPKKKTEQEQKQEQEKEPEKG